MSIFNNTSFWQDYMGELQVDQLRRYVEIKQSDMPSAVAAKKTKEFRYVWLIYGFVQS